MGKLDSKIALVTGGSRGIGKSISLALAKEGAKIALNYRSSAAEAQSVADEIKALGSEAFVAQGDVSDGTQARNLVKQVLDHFGTIDILVNNAGITRDGLAAMMKENDWDSVLDTNLKGAFLCSKAVMRAMMKKRWGRIINVSSVVGFVGNGGQVNYAAAKAGLVGLTKSLARELAGRNITVNCVAPGYITTDMTDGLTEDVQQALKAQIPLGILGTPEDVAASVGFLASADGNYLTGQTLHVNGGMYMGH